MLGLYGVIRQYLHDYTAYENGKQKVITHDINFQTDLHLERIILEIPSVLPAIFTSD